MTIGAFDATAAYGRSIKTITPSLGDSAAATQGSEAVSSFGSMVESMVSNAATSLRTAEAESAKHVAGKGDLIDVVTAIGAAEAALDTVVAVRDRVVNAYSEIMRMQI
jgi:flagellar hook-basal body complex protein FliE